MVALAWMSSWRRSQTACEVGSAAGWPKRWSSIPRPAPGLLLSKRRCELPGLGGPLGNPSGTGGVMIALAMYIAVARWKQNVCQRRTRRLDAYRTGVPLAIGAASARGRGSAWSHVPPQGCCYRRGGLRPGVEMCRSATRAAPRARPSYFPLSSRSRVGVAAEVIPSRPLTGGITDVSGRVQAIDATARCCPR